MVHASFLILLASSPRCCRARKDLEDDDEGEEMSMIGTGLEEAAIEATRRRSLRLSQRDQRNPRTTRNRNMDNHVDDFEEDEEADVEAVMAAAAEESERDRRTRGDEGGRDVRTAPKHAVSTVDEEEDEGSEGSGGDSVGGRAVGIDLVRVFISVCIFSDENASGGLGGLCFCFVSMCLAELCARHGRTSLWPFSSWHLKRAGNAYWFIR